MIASIQSVNQQTMYDLCSQAYGTLDLLVKFCNDNGVSDVNYVPPIPQVFYYDTELVRDGATNNYTYATQPTPIAATCGIVTGLTNTTIGALFLGFKWDDAAVMGYEYAYNTTGVTPVSGWAFTSMLAVTISELKSETNYYFFVRAQCGSDFYSTPVVVTAETISANPLWTSPWLDPEVTNPSPGTFMEYAITPFAIFDGTGNVDIPVKILYTEAEEDAYLIYLNSGTFPTLSGTFTRTTGVFAYSLGGGEGVVSIPETLYKKTTMVFTRDTAPTLDAGYRYAGANNKQAIDWGDGEPIEYYTNTDAGAHIVEHAIPGDGAGIPVDVNLFHNDKFTLLQFVEDNSIYPSTSNIREIGGLFPNNLQALGFLSCGQLGFTDNIAHVDISMCPALVTFQIQTCSLVEAFDVFNSSNPLLRILTLRYNPLNSAAVDAALNDFVANTWSGTTTTGTFDIRCSPAAPATGASSASRTALLAAGMAVYVDP